jgi:hypothetical protein
LARSGAGSVSVRVKWINRSRPTFHLPRRVVTSASRQAGKTYATFRRTSESRKVERVVRIKPEDAIGQCGKSDAPGQKSPPRRRLHRIRNVWKRTSQRRQAANLHATNGGGDAATHKERQRVAKCEKIRKAEMRGVGNSGAPTNLKSLSKDLLLHRQLRPQVASRHGRESNAARGSGRKIAGMRQAQVRSVSKDAVAINPTSLSRGLLRSHQRQTFHVRKGSVPVANSHHRSRIVESFKAIPKEAMSSNGNSAVAGRRTNRHQVPRRLQLSLHLLSPHVREASDSSPKPRKRMSNRPVRSDRAARLQSAVNPMSSNSARPFSKEVKVRGPAARKANSNNRAVTVRRAIRVAPRAKGRKRAKARVRTGKTSKRLLSHGGERSS